jgi:ferredoxin-NADP reductase
VVDTALPASLTAAHFALAAFRHHRSRSSFLNLFVLPSFVVAATPWIWSSTTALLAVLCAHVAWVVVCEIVTPPPASAAAAEPASTRPSITRPSPTRAAWSERSSQSLPVPRDQSGFAPVTVLAVLDETSDIKTFRLSRPPGFDFKPGQFAPVRMSIDGKPHVRCYSISSSPDSRGYFEISVRRQGLVSTTLHATVRQGSQLTIGKPAGHFVYPADDERPLALLAGGIGITPLLSMLRFAVSSHPTRPVTLLYSARNREALAFLPELRVLAQRHPQLRIGITVSEPEAPAPWRTGRIDLPFVKQYVAHPAHTIFCVCGPTAMMIDMERLLVTAGVPPAQIRSEKFETAVAATVLNARSTAHDGDANQLSHFSVTFAATGRTSRAPGSRTLLETAEAEGIAITSSCRSGVCQSCRTRLADGEVDCQSTVLDAEDRAAGFILPCVSWAQSDCVLEA